MENVNATRIRIAAAGFLGLFAVLVQSSQAAQAAGACQTSGPSSGAYTVTVCITQPTDGSIVSGAVPVTASISVTGASPGLSWPLFSLDGNYFTMGKEPWVTPVQITVPSAKYVDGLHTLGFKATVNDGFNSTMATVRLIFANGVPSPPVNTGTFKPAFTSPPAGQP